MRLKIEAQTAFIKEICSYYMDFLKTGFKKTRFPKRYLRITDEKTSQKNLIQGFHQIPKITSQISPP